MGRRKGEELRPEEGWDDFPVNSRPLHLQTSESAVTTESRGVAQKEGASSHRVWIGGEASAGQVAHGCDLGVRRS